MIGFARRDFSGDGGIQGCGRRVGGIDSRRIMKRRDLACASRRCIAIFAEGIAPCA